ncbi:MAG TPA: hypothetical protein PK006_10720, partial [Saprospiraceae bacterium]|nr:hypothetical protein [Saprospiraceae bacterium]
MAQSPHGDKLKVDCKVCHSPNSWTDRSFYSKFPHDSTAFPLLGQHSQINCNACHSLKFEQVKKECRDCHQDVHQNSVGQDCKRCHTANSWVIHNSSELHEQVNFPLRGVHQTAVCIDCHRLSSQVNFTVAGVQCIDCHRKDFEKTIKPDHNKKGFGTNCLECHSLTEDDWHTDKLDHSFFPLEKSHEIKDCKACHKSEDYSMISARCVSCHQSDYDASLNPNHKQAKISNDCAQCHSLEPNWRPAVFSTHDGLYFPIYSGKHQNKWTQCVDCHTNSSDYTQFTCVSCHKNPETDEAHKNVGGYQYQDNACLACHPTGDAGMPFDHNTSQFPLTGAHLSVNCLDCHKTGYKGTPTECKACHQNDFDASLNPNHKNLGISNDCASCHTTTPGWAPARFDVHDQYYELKGAHKAIAANCVQCHNGDYNNTPNSCVGCHQSDYDKTQNPNHKSTGFSNDCASCHTESSWTPANFDHDGMYFPIYSGKHKGKWTQCLDCHNNPNNFAQFTCVSCHKNPETDEAHKN